MAAVRHDDRLVVNSRGGPSDRQLDDLEAAIGDVDYPIGHNLIRKFTISSDTSNVRRLA